MKRLIRSLKKRVAKSIVDNFLTDSHIAESSDRQKFFFNAFKILSFNGIDGDYFEFGSRGGRSLGLAYHEAKKFKSKTHFYAFDSFEGLPESTSEKDYHPVWVKGTQKSSIETFHQHCRKRKIPAERYTAVKGFYNESLVGGEADALPSNIAFVYIDCDMYSSTMDVLKFLEPRLKNGMIIAFDDYFCISNTQIAGERKAMLEVFDDASEWNLLPYLPFSYVGMSFIVEKKSLLND